MAIPINKAAGPDNPNPAVHLMSLMHDLPVSKSGLSFGMCFLGMASHGDCHTHVDALNHVGYKGLLYNGKPASTLTSRGSEWGSIAAYATGIVGRGVLLDAAHYRKVDWLEPGEAVNRAELEAIEKAQGVKVGEGDILVFRTGHHARRLALGAWSNDYPPAGQGKAGLHVDTVPWMHERKIAAFLPDGDGETVPSNVEDMPYPIHRPGESVPRGRPLGVPGDRPAPAAARCDRLALESDRDLLRAAEREDDGTAFRRQGSDRNRRDDRHRPGDRGAACLRGRARRRQYTHD
jgi:kynurenine formamidase